MRMFVHLVGRINANGGRGIRYPLVRERIISALASEAVRPNPAHTATITTIIFLSCSSDCRTTVVLSVYSVPHSNVARGLDLRRLISPASPRLFSFWSSLERVQDLCEVGTAVLYSCCMYFLTSVPAVQASGVFMVNLITGTS